MQWWRKLESKRMGAWRTRDHMHPRGPLTGPRVPLIHAIKGPLGLGQTLWNDRSRLWLLQSRSSRELTILRLSNRDWIGQSWATAFLISVFSLQKSRILIPCHLRPQAGLFFVSQTRLTSASASVYSWKVIPYVCYKWSKGIPYVYCRIAVLPPWEFKKDDTH